MNDKQWALGALLMLMAAGAFGQTAGVHRWYVGLDYGESRLDRDDDFNSLVEGDFNSDTFALRVGYRFSRFFSLEAGYADIGDFSATYVTACVPFPGVVCPSYQSRTSIDSFLVHAIGTWPIAEHFQLKGVLGANYRELKASISYPTVTNSWSDTNTVFSYGLGIAVPVNERFEIDVDYAWYREVGLGLTLSSSVGVIDEAESQVATLGVRYRF